jgi:alkylation response protein AidB-like acyl-CoA dehydrogenase
MDHESFNMVLDSAKRWFEQENPLADRIAEFRSGHTASAGAWAAMDDMGWTALARPEDAGGFGADTAQCFEFLRLAGRHARPEPLDLMLMLAGGPALPMLENARLALADVERGDEQLSFSEFDAQRVAGRSAALYGGAQATHALLPVPRRQGGIHMVCVPMQGAGVRQEPVRWLDGRHTVRLYLDNAAVQTVGAGVPAEAAAQQIMDRAAAGLVADAAGVLEAAFELTLDYLKQRQQFGQPLSRLQALQHCMADIFCDLQFLLALTRRLASEMDVPEASHWPTLPAAKSFVGRRALRAVGQLIQVSGGIGMTEEYRLGHFYKRLHVAASLFGGAEQQLSRIDTRRTLLPF